MAIGGQAHLNEEPLSRPFDVAAVLHDRLAVCLLVKHGELDENFRKGPKVILEQDTHPSSVSQGLMRV